MQPIKLAADWRGGNFDIVIAKGKPADKARKRLAITLNKQLRQRLKRHARNLVQ